MQDFEKVLTQSGTDVAAFEESHRSFLQTIQHLLHGNPTLVPVIVLVVVCSFVLFLFTAIIPKFVALLTSVNAELPFITVLMFGISDFAKATWWMWLVGGAVVLIGVKLGLKKSKSFATKFDWMLLKIPLFGELNRMIAMSRRCAKPTGGCGSRSSGCSSGVAAAAGVHHPHQQPVAVPLAGGVVAQEAGPSALVR